MSVSKRSAWAGYGRKRTSRTASVDDVWLRSRVFKLYPGDRKIPSRAKSVVDYPLARVDGIGVFPQQVHACAVFRIGKQPCQGVVLEYEYKNRTPFGTSTVLK